MKTSSTLIIALLCSFNSFSQNEFYWDHNWKACLPHQASFYSLTKNTDEGLLREDYFAQLGKLQMRGHYRDASFKIPEGSFTYWYFNGILEKRGSYVNGKRDGLWLTFHPNGSLSDSVVYEAGHPVGTRLRFHSNGFLADSIVYGSDHSVKVSWFENGNVASAGYFTVYEDSLYGHWVYYHQNGQKCADEIYDLAGELKSSVYYDENGKDISDKVEDREACFKKGEKDWLKYVYQSIYFPKNVKIVNADTVRVIINYTINENGKIEDIFLSAPFAGEFNDIALTAIRSSPKWKPAYSHNQPRKMYFRQPLTFIQEE